MTPPPDRGDPTPDMELLVYGAGGFGREVAWLAGEASPPARVVAYVDDAAAGSALHGIPVLGLAEAVRRYPRAAFVVAVGSGSAREEMAAKAVSAGLSPARLVHRRVEMSGTVAIGEGTVVCAGCILTVDITIGAHVQINLDCTVGHDTVIEDYVTLAPGVHVSGCVRLERGSYIGTGASIINGTIDEPLVVGAGATIGAGAVVTRSIPPGVTAVGIPARARG
jgi:sugar O-acyltransferase (sialic acid O-acetyltransferase NeuD family)